MSPDRAKASRRPPEASSAIPGDRLDVEGLGFSYEGGHAVLKDISFSVGPGRIVAILGPNGSGKTTLLNCMARLAMPGRGIVRIGGVDASSLSLDEMARSVSFVPQSTVPAFDYEVIEYVVTGCAPRMGLFKKPGPEEYAIARRAIEALGLGHLERKPYTRISGGERQQVSIARALAQRSGIMLLDEPTAHLDYGNQIKVLRIIKDLAAKGYAIAMTTHAPDHAILLDDQVAALGRDGSFRFGTAREAMSGSFLSSLYGIGIEVRTLEDLGRAVCVAHPFV